MKESMIVCIEISSANKFIQKLFNLAVGRFLGPRGKSKYHFCLTVKRMVYSLVA